MKVACDQIENRLKETKSASNSVLFEAEQLFYKEDVNKVQKVIAEKMIDRFLLTDAEVEHISSDVIDDRFFDVINKIYAITNDCQVLIQMEDQRLGNELKEMNDTYLQTAFKKLYKWVRQECLKIVSDTAEFDKYLIKAFELLQDRPVFLKFCLEEFSDVRSKAVSAAFLQALIRGGDGGIPRPIDIYAHDPRRYVSDMSAWVHQAMANEHELISSLLRQLRKETEEEKIQYQELVSNVLNKTLDGLCDPFRSRCQQLFALEHQPVLIFQLYSFFEFYEKRFSNLIGPHSSITLLFQEFKDISFNDYFKTVKKLMENLESNLPVIANDLSPPHEFRQILHHVDSILTMHNTSLVENDKGGAMTFVTPFLDGLMKCLDSICDVGKEAQLDSQQICTYKINCYKLVSKLLSRHGYTEKATEINGFIDSEKVIKSKLDDQNNPKDMQ